MNQAARQIEERLSTFISVRQAAIHYGCTVGVIRALIKIKTLPAIKIGREWRIKKTDVKGYDERTKQ